MKNNILNLYIPVSTNYSKSITLYEDDNSTPLNVVNYTVNAALTDYYDSTNVITFDATLSTGNLTLTLSSNITSTLNSLATYVFDAHIKNSTSNNITRVAEGKIYIKSTVTTNV